MIHGIIFTLAFKLVYVPVIRCGRRAIRWHLDANNRGFLLCLALNAVRGQFGQVLDTAD